MARVDVRFLCEHIYKLLMRDNYYFSPVREDGQNPAFAIREDGQVAIDHATGEGFNALSLIAKVESLPPSEARQRLIFYAEHIGCLAPQDHGKFVPKGARRQAASWQRLPETHNWHSLVVGSPDDYARFAKLRGLNPVALMAATAMGLLFFQDDYPRDRLCVITDNARHTRQDRPIDGGWIKPLAGGITKSRTLGTGSWPIGAANIGHKPVVLLVEGMPDLLAAMQVILEENRLHEAAPVTMLGAGQHINVHSLPHFVGKHVRIFPDRDEAGMKGAATWTEQLQGIAASIDCFSFDAFPLSTQKPIKDLNDFVAAGGTAACQHMVPNAGGEN